MKDDYLTIDNLKVHYIEGGKGQSLVLIPGWTDSCVREFYKIVPAFLKHFHVLSFDLPGCGHSNELRGKHTIDSYADFVYVLLNEKKMSKINLLGVSMGGTVALRFMEKYPQFVNKLVLVSSPYRGDDFCLFFHFLAYLFRFKSLRKILTSSFRKKITKFFKFEKDFQHLPPEDKIKAIENFQKIRARQADESIESLFEIDLTGFCRKIQTPTLIIDGKYSQLVPARVSKNLHKLIQGSKLVVFPNTAHGLVLEKPEEFEKTVLDFLKS